MVRDGVPFWRRSGWQSASPFTGKRALNMTLYQRGKTERIDAVKWETLGIYQPSRVDNFERAGGTFGISRLL
jgi:hypothetical protein